MDTMNFFRVACCNSHRIEIRSTQDDHRQAKVWPPPPSPWALRDISSPWRSRRHYTPKPFAKSRPSCSLSDLHAPKSYDAGHSINMTANQCATCHWRTQRAARGCNTPHWIFIFLNCVFAQNYCPSSAPVHINPKFCTWKSEKLFTNFNSLLQLLGWRSPF